MTTDDLDLPPELPPMRDSLERNPPTHAEDQPGRQIPEHDVPTAEWQAYERDVRQILDRWRYYRRLMRRPEQDPAYRRVAELAREHAAIYAAALRCVQAEHEALLWELYFDLCMAGHCEPDWGLKPASVAVAKDRSGKS